MSASLYELLHKIEILESRLERQSDLYAKALDDASWYRRELRKYIKQSKITERRKQDGKFEKR